MSWLWGSSSSDKGHAHKDDPLQKLDPALRVFLEKESPVKYQSSSSSRADSDSQHAPPPETPSSSSTAPSQSLYKDGRYADIWSTYKPLSQIEGQSKTEQEKLLDVLDGYKYRKAEIGRAALENCALEQCALNDCFKSGGLSSRMTMCRAENRELTRCYEMQAVG